MLYGDSPVKLNEHKDALGLNRYTMLPDILAVRQSGNLYAYCVANPIRYIDKTGAAAEVAAAAVAAVGSIIVEAAAYAFLITAAVVATVNCIDAVSTAIFSRTAPIEEEKVVAKEKVTEKQTISSQTTKIYRYGSTNPGNFTPKEKDSFTGLSFLLTPPASGSYSVTTIEAINATGGLIAIQDGPNHVSVIPSPAMGTLQDWIETGTSHPCTAIVRSVVVKVR